jgi:multidrug efflux pump subunit AcrA (membrane-fusion protein)
MLHRLAWPILIVFVGFGAWGYWTAARLFLAETGIPATMGTLSTIVAATGRVAPLTEVTLANKIPGRIKAVLVKEGDFVEVGQPVVLFDDQEALARIRMAEMGIQTAHAEIGRARSAVEAARARWMEVKSGARPQEIARAEAEGEQARQRWQSAETERARFNRLLAGGYIGRSQYEVFATEASVARARLQAAEESLNLLVAGAKPESVQSAFAQVQEAENHLKQVQSRLAQAMAERDHAQAVWRTSTVTSTINGKVTRKLVEPGEAVDIGTAVVVVADVQKIIVKAEIDETDLGKLTLGQRAEVTAEAYPGRVFPASVYEIGQSVGKRKMKTEDPLKIGDLKVLESKLELTNNPEELKLGMTVDVRIIVAHKANAILLPKTLVPLGSKSTVVTVAGPKGPETRTITLGTWGDSGVEVTSGLRAGDRVLPERPAAP